MEYSENFQDNICLEKFNKRAEDILKWIKENRENFDLAKNPNAYEMVNLFLFAAKYAQEGKDVDLETLKQIWQIRSKDFSNCGISENHFVYKICEDAYQASQNRISLVDDEDSHFALRKMAGIGLFLKQQQRDDKKVQYDNPQELIGLIIDSKDLKEKYSQLFQKYEFKENIDVLCELQFQRDLPGGLQYEIGRMNNELSYPITTHTDTEVYEDEN